MESKSQIYERERGCVEPADKVHERNFGMPVGEMYMCEAFGAGNSTSFDGLARSPECLHVQRGRLHLSV